MPFLSFGEVTIRFPVSTAAERSKDAVEPRW